MEQQNFQQQFILALLAYAVQRNIDPQRLCENAGIAYKDLVKKKSNVPLTGKTINALWKNAFQGCNDPLFGLHFGESMQLAALGAVGQLIQTSNTVGEALTNGVAATPLLTDMFRMEVQHRGKHCKLFIIPDEEKAIQFPYTFRHMADFLMVFALHELDGLLLEKVVPVAARFPYAVNHEPEYQRLFRCPLPARSKELSLEFPARLLEAPVLSANYELQQHLLQKVNLLVKNDSGGGSLHVKIFNYLVANSYLHALSLESVAANFNFSTRTLQRKLKEEGITFFQIVEEVRQTLAMQYLRSSSYSVKDVSHILGYHEPTAFVRAFKRWTGQTPLEYQRANK